MGVYQWSTTAGDNDNAATGIDWTEGQLPSTVNNSAREMMADVAEFLADLSCSVTSGGTASALTLTTTGTVPALGDGIILGFIAGTAANAGATLNVDSLGAKEIRRANDTALQAGDVVSGAAYLVVYDASADSASGAWLVLNPTITTISQITRNADITPSADATYDLGSTSLRWVEGHIDRLFAALGSASAPTYTFEGDLNTGIWSPAADTIAFSTAGTEHLRIDATGQVGIGTTSPAAKFDIVASGVPFEVQQSSGTPEEIIANFLASDGRHLRILQPDPATDSDPFTFLTNNAYLFRVDTTDAMIINAAGNVGIGTTSPSTSLHVDGPIRCASYTVATVPSASTVGPGTMIFVSDEAGGGVMAFSDGTAWRRVTDRATIS